MLTPPQALEAILFAKGEVLERKEAAKLLGIEEKQLDAVIDALIEQLKERGISLLNAANGLELRTNAEAAPFIKKLRENELSRDLGRAGLETLAIIAYKKGATRSEVDWVRGVNSSASMRTLLLRGLIEGHEDSSDHRRIRYEVTTEALAHLGVVRLEDLPRFVELSVEATEVRLPDSQEGSLTSVSIVE